MILIKNISIITQNSNREIIENGAIVIEKDRIKEIGESREIEKKYKKIKKEIEGKGKVALPGLINAHGHLTMTLLRGYADDLALEDWWLNYVYPIETKFGRQEVYYGSLLAMMEMIKSGTTCFTDFYYYQDEVAKAAEKIGMRGMLGYAVLDAPTFYFKNASEAFRKIERGLSSLNSKAALVFSSLAPHMFQTTSLAVYQKAKKMANQYNLILQTHAAETKQEVDFCLKKYRKRPVEVLNQRGILDKRTVLAHCCWLNKKEIKILAKTKTSAVHCPVSNMKLASGFMPLPEMLKLKINVALGTDSACSNNNLDMFEEMKIAALIHKGRYLDAKLVSAQTALDMATINGARALGREAEIGSLETGKKADLIILDLNQPHLTPAHNLVSLLVYAAKGADVETAIINGRIVMENKKIKKINEKSMLDKIKRVAKYKIK